MTETIARETKSPGDQVARHPRLLNRGGSTGRRRHDPDRETHPEASTSGSHHSSQEEQTHTAKARTHKPRPGEQNGSDKEAQMPETKQKGTAEPPPRMQKQPQLPYSMTAPRDEHPDRFTKNLEGPEQQEEMLTQHSPQIEESLLHTFQRQREAERQQQSPHLPAAHAWLASRSPKIASGQRREATSPMIASGHENGEGDRLTAIGHIATGSGQTAATGHARAISEGPVAVRKPPLATPKPLERTQ